MVRKGALLVFALAMALAVLGAATNVTAQDTLKIGLLSDQTGGLLLYGTELERGFMLGLKYATDGTMEVAGRPIEVLVRDNASDPTIGATQARELLERDGAEVLVGAPSSGVTTQVMPIALDQDVILMAGPAASPTITSTDFNLNVFRACRNSFQDALTLASVLPDLGVKKVFVFGADSVFGRGTAAAFQIAYGLKGVDVLEPVFADQATTDFTPYIDQMIDSGANALQPIWAGDSAIALYTQLNERGIGAPDWVRIEAFNSNPVVAASFTAEQVDSVGYIVYHYTLPQTEVNDWLIENHKADYDGALPDLFTECGFATAQALVAGLTATEGDATPDALRPALEGLTWDGPRGEYWLRPSDHQAMMPMYIARLTNNTDPEFKFYELVKEVPASEVIPPCNLPEALADRCTDEALNTPPESMME
ncbi:MAG: substrate-binding domain-containing protein [Anaerolineae bacterium]|nr:substrate-binding domain-containing protein [Anaerolineae bacterium]